MSQHILSLYNDRSSAVEAVNLLKDTGFNEKHISLMDHADVGDEVQVQDSNMAAKRVGISALLGIIAGLVLSALPETGILYGIGIVAGAIAGFDIGIITGTIISVLAIKHMGKEIADRYAVELEHGKTLLAFSGHKKEVLSAQKVLEKHGFHAEFSNN